MCAIVKGNLEIPSDLHGIVYTPLPQGQDLSTIAFELIRELRIAGYDVDANALLNLGANATPSVFYAAAVGIEYHRVR